MITKIQICIDGKFVLNKFQIIQHENKLIIKSYDCKHNIIKVPIYNQYNGIDYAPLCFPLTLTIIDKYVFNPYIILSTFNFKYENDIDFFYCLENVIFQNYKYTFIKFDEIFNDTISYSNPIKILNDNYNGVLTLDNLQTNIIDIHNFISNLWFDIYLIKLCVMFCLIKFPYLTNKNLKEITQKYNLPKKILTISKHISNIKYSITNKL